MSEQQLNPKVCQLPIPAIVTKIPNIANIMYPVQTNARPSGAAPTKSLPPPAKVRMQKPQGGGKFLVQILGVHTYG